MNSVKVYTDNSVIDLGTGEYFKLGYLQIKSLLKKYRKQKNQKSNADLKFITYVESNLERFYRRASSSSDNAIIQSIESLGFLPEEESNEVYTDNSFVNLGNDSHFILGDFPKKFLLKEYRKEKKKTSNADLKFIAYVELNLQRFYDEAKALSKSGLIQSIESLDLPLIKKQSVSSKKKAKPEPPKGAYMDDSVIDLGSGTYFKIGDLSITDLLKRYRKHKKKAKNMDVKFIVYVESNLKRFYGEAKALGKDGLVQSIESLGIISITPVLDKKSKKTKTKIKKEKFCVNTKEESRGVCVSRKVTYFFKKDAVTALGRIQSGSSSKDYLCHLCGFWHLSSITSVPRKEQKKRKKRKNRKKKESRFQTNKYE